jgi:hypothetical protein
VRAHPRLVAHAQRLGIRGQHDPEKLLLVRRSAHSDHPVWGQRSQQPRYDLASRLIHSAVLIDQVVGGAVPFALH